ncbi:MAG: hypothetical protein WC708_09520 [Lentisphaeria bacterium]
MAAICSVPTGRNPFKPIHLVAAALVAAVVLALAGGCAPAVRAPAKTVPVARPAATALTPVLCLASEDLAKQGLTTIEPKALEAYRRLGFDLHFGCYQTTDEARLRQFPVVIGMMPQLHAGTRAIDARLGAAIERYVRDGGAFLLLPAPSYYGVEDFVRQLNPWLQPLGAELLNEQPRDPANQRTISRVLGYRYLRVDGITPHPATRGIPFLWVPIDFTDAYLVTHTMRVSSDWQVLVRGGAACRSIPYQACAAGQTTPGAYASAPPLLAVRPLGKGRLALFATSSQYYLFDAYHWSLADGFVMEAGNGRQLMGQLLDWLVAEGRAAGFRPAPLPAAAVPETPPGSAVAVSPDKASWLDDVLRRRIPSGHGVAGYVDCGALSDLPYRPDRGRGWLPGGAPSWPVRSDTHVVFHATGANARAFGPGPLTYRFDGLPPRRACRGAILLWAFQAGEGASVALTAAGRAVAGPWRPPRLADGRGPAWLEFAVPAEAVTAAGTLELAFNAVPGAARTAAVAELWLFVPGTPVPDAAGLVAGFEKPFDVGAAVPPALPARRGLIGARSTVSGAPHAPADLCGAARAAGLDFLVFTEDAARLDPPRWDAFRAECARLSDSSFRAVPGVRFTARYAAAGPPRPDHPQSWGTVAGYVFQHVAQPPPPAELDNGYELFWHYLGGQLAGGRGAMPTLATPGRNAIPPWYQRFWRGFDVVTLDGTGRVIEDDRKLFAELLAAGYGPFPRAAGDFTTPAGIRQAANGWVTVIPAARLEQLEDAHHAATAGNGPLIRNWRLNTDFGVNRGPGEGVLIRGAAWALVHAEVEAAAELATVTLFSGREPLRVWRPHGRRWTVDEPVLMARNHEWHLQVTDAAGRQALSSRFLVEDGRFMMGMCADNQNTICNLTVPPPTFDADERGLYWPHSYWHTGEAAGQLGVMRNLRDLVPRVIETGIVQPVKYFHPSPLLRFADGTTEDHDAGELRIARAGGDANVTTYTFDTPGSWARSWTTLTTFRPAPGGDTAMLVEWTLEAKAPLAFAGDRPGLVALRLALIRALAPGWRASWRVAAPGGLVTRALPADDPQWRAEAVLAPDGGLLLWPNAIGNLAVLPLDGTAYGLGLAVAGDSKHREFVELRHPVRALPAGGKLSCRYLVVLHQGEVRDGGALDGLRAAYVAPAPGLRLDTGRLLSAGWPPVAAADPAQRAVTGSVATANRHDPLPLVVRGVNDRWSCGRWWDGRLTVMEAQDSRLDATLEPGLAAGPFFAGNLLLADQEQVRLEWGGQAADGGIWLHAHNPGKLAVDCRIRTNPLCPGLPAADVRCAIPAGASAWYWCRGTEIRPASPPNSDHTAK